MARDTLCAAINAVFVDGVVVVCDPEEDVESLSYRASTSWFAKD